MRDHRLLFIAGSALMALSLTLNRLVHVPDFFSGLIFGVGAGLLMLFVARGSGRPLLR